MDESPRKLHDRCVGSARPAVGSVRYDRHLMEAAWTGFLQGSGPAGHAVQVYRDVSELADSVSKYLATGLTSASRP